MRKGGKSAEFIYERIKDKEAAQVIGLTLAMLQVYIVQLEGTS